MVANSKFLSGVKKMFNQVPFVARGLKTLAFFFPL